MDQTSFYSQEQSFRELHESQYQCFGMEVVPGNACQLHCEACYKKMHSALASQLDSQYTPLPVAKNYIDQAREAGFSEAALLGGEPTLHPNITDILRHIRDRGLLPILCTNGIKLADARLAQEINEVHPTVVTHAYFPGGEEVIDRYADRNGYAAQLKTAIDNMLARQQTTLVLEMPLTDSLFPHAYDFFRYCRHRNVIPFVEISRHRDTGASTTNITPEQITELFEQFREYDRKYDHAVKEPTICPPAYNTPCTMSITGAHVKNSGGGDFGGVFSCCAQRIRHGDLREEPLAMIMQSQTMGLYKNQDRYIVGPCKDCDIYSICRGGCRGEALLTFGCPRASCPACSRIPEHVRRDPDIMAPESCTGCPAENADGCSLLHKQHVR